MGVGLQPRWGGGGGRGVWDLLGMALWGNDPPPSPEPWGRRMRWGMQGPCEAAQAQHHDIRALITDAAWDNYRAEAGQGSA